MATLNPVIAFLFGMFTIVVAILIFYFSARRNKNSADLYRQTICSGILQ